MEAHPFSSKTAKKLKKNTHNISFKRVQTSKTKALGFSLKIVGIAQQQRALLVARLLQDVGAPLFHLEEQSIRPTRKSAAKHRGEQLRLQRDAIETAGWNFKPHFCKTLHISGNVIGSECRAKYLSHRSTQQIACRCVAVLQGAPAAVKTQKRGTKTRK